MVGKRRREGSVWALGILLAALVTPAIANAAPLDAEQADRRRIQRHLSQVEQQLRQAPVEHLAAAAQLGRARLLDELHRYWQAGVFPQNSQHPNQLRPYFIDDAGRACAVGALIQRSGHDALAARIDDSFHHEYVPNMHDTELLAWASQHGFSVAELALIQPSYCACGTGWDGAGGAGGAAAEEAAAYQPVCGADGLTYWNTCIAELCGGIEIVAEGECEHEAPCELCGPGDSYVAVSECTQDAPEGICGFEAPLSVIPVSDRVAAAWLEMQQRNCANPDYELPIGDQSAGWQPALPAGEAGLETWSCGSEAGTSSGGASGAGASEPSPGASGEPSTEAPAGGAGSGEAGASATSGGLGSEDDEPTSGCTCTSATAPDGFGAPLALLALALLRGRRRARPSAVDAKSLTERTVNRE